MHRRVTRLMTKKSMWIFPSFAHRAWLIWGWGFPSKHFLPLNCDHFWKIHFSSLWLRNTTCLPCEELAAQQITVSCKSKHNRSLYGRRARSYVFRHALNHHMDFAAPRLCGSECPVTSDDNEIPGWWNITDAGVSTFSSVLRQRVRQRQPPPCHHLLQPHRQTHTHTPQHSLHIPLQMLSG